MFTVVVCQDLAPLVLMFNVALPSSQFVDGSTGPGPAAVHAIQQRFGVSVVVRVQQKQFDGLYAASSGSIKQFDGLYPASSASVKQFDGLYPASSSSVKQLVTVRGSVCNVDAITQATSALFQLFTGHKMVSILLCTLPIHASHLS